MWYAIKKFFNPAIAEEELPKVGSQYLSIGDDQILWKGGNIRETSNSHTVVIVHDVSYDNKNVMYSYIKVDGRQAAHLAPGSMWTITYYDTTVEFFNRTYKEVIVHEES
jgi:hypothetical protein